MTAKRGFPVFPMDGTLTLSENVADQGAARLHYGNRVRP